ncbi:MAG: GNAT family N-acetyltransferase [Paenisporosarcina sp.]
MIEKATDQDKEFIFSEVTNSIREGTQQLLKEEKAFTLFEGILNKGGFYLVYRNADRSIAGWILLGENTDYFSEMKHGFIYDVYVLPQYRGKGISKVILREGISTLKEQGFNEVRLNVYSTNHAKEIYKKLGFQDLNTIMAIKV